MWVTWALLNLVATLGLSPSAWFREVSPIRKKGPGTVSQVDCLRPVSYVDDLQGFFDAAWLEVVRGPLEQYSGRWQAGGKYDAVLMVLGLLVALQLPWLLR